MIPRLFASAFLLLMGFVCARAEVRLPNLFTDHMVLQQGTSVPVWGWAADGERVTVEFRGQKQSTTARDGRWMVKLKNLKPGAPGTLKVTGTRKNGAKTEHTVIQIADVLVGEVWLASGQSNMEWAMRLTYQPSNAIATAANRDIRLFTVPKLKLNEPTNNVNAAWRVCGPDAVSNFSAVAYYFARDLQAALGVPVGIIHTSWGGSPAEVWISEEVLANDPEFRRDILEAFAPQRARYTNSLAQWETRREAARKAGTNFSQPRPQIWTPSELYNGMIAPLVPFAVKGAIWYQGESNAGRAWQYRRLFPTMIENWREDWGRDFTFLEVQLAPWDKNRKRSYEQITAEPVESDWAELREAQALTAARDKNVGMAVITDYGDKDDIHPAKKEPVGARLALLARKMAYGENIVAEGPTFAGVKFGNGRAVVSFKNVEGGLEERGGKLTGFSVAGEDRKFVWADAVIAGDKVIVSSPAVAKPVAVRYGWADYPVVNLFNREGLPASPFRTDDWDLMTKPKGGAKATSGKAMIEKAGFIYEKAPFPSCHASTIVETGEGLVAAWFGGSDEGNNDVTIWTAREQNGKWGPPVEVATGMHEGKQYPCWNPVLYQAPKGPLLLFYKVGPSPSTWWGMMMRSEDGGRTWSTPERLPNGILGPVRNKPVLVGDTLWCGSSSEHDGWRIHMEYTRDLGRTWDRTVALNGKEDFGAIQPTILVWPRNHVQLLCRSRQGKVTEVWTRDGKNFTPMRPTSLVNPSSGIDAVMLRDGRALLVYNDTPKGRSPLSVAISSDGTNWANVVTLESEPGEYSYPAIIQANDGRVHVTYTWKRQRIKHVVLKL